MVLAGQNGGSIVLVAQLLQVVPAWYPEINHLSFASAIQ
jgi:hypothetical protein